MFRPDPKPVKKPKKAVKPLKFVSKRTSKKLTQYTRLKKQFIVGKICPVYPHLPVCDVHHKAGRIGNLLLDTRFWIAVSRKGHMKIELNPKWARSMGYSMERII